MSESFSFTGSLPTGGNCSSPLPVEIRFSSKSNDYRQLRYVHRSTHLDASDFLRSEQITLYDKLRGYSSDDPCQNIPKRHYPEMWKKHYNCP